MYNVTKSIWHFFQTTLLGSTTENTQLFLKKNMVIKMVWKTTAVLKWNIQAMEIGTLKNMQIIF